MKLLLPVLFFLHLTVYSQTLTPVELADLQLKGYNERNINLFLEAYSDSIKVFTFPDQLLYTGKAQMKINYEGMFVSLPDLHCTLKNRIVIGNTVIDEESVLIRKDQPLIHAVAIYKIAHGKIQEVYFISNR
jgi:hypothetical protein